MVTAADCCDHFLYVAGPYSRRTHAVGEAGMDNALDELRAAMNSKPKPTPFVGTGLSLAISGQPEASWRGLLLDGVEVCRQRVSPLPDGWVERMKDELDNADVFSYLAAADQIARRLRDIEDGRVFDSWIQTTVGNLKPRGNGEQIIKAVRRLGDVIVTTNYDTLIEDLTPTWTPYTWQDSDYGPADRDDQVVLHMHGVATKPDSVILSSADYERLSANDLAQLLDKGLFARHRFVFIGCGEGLGDPNIAPLMDFVNKHMPKKAAGHYLLVTGGQLRGLIERPISRLITPVAYGSEFGELSGFLQALAGGEEIRVSQDPAFYERRAGARPKGTVFDLAGQAEAKLDAALDALHRTEHAMHQVEQLAVPPPGSDGWEYEHQKAVHKDLAASLAPPAEHLVSCSADLAGVFGTATADVWELAPTFGRNTARLARITERVSRLEDASERLLGRVLRVRGDLRDRIDDLSRGYQEPYRALHAAAADIDRAHSGMATLRDGLSRPRPTGYAADPGRPPGRGTAAPHGLDADAVSEMGTADSRPAPAGPRPRRFADAVGPAPGVAGSGDIRSVPLLSYIAAGEPRPVDDSNVKEYLPLPARHVRGEKVFLLKVEGNSMTGADGILDGDYIIVEKREDWDDGDMVVVLLEDDDYKATVKRIWRDGKEILLQPSNPDLPTLVYSEADNPYVQGRVIGVVRWHVGAGHRRAEPQA
jgi:SOS-response transcriptional repressor LexA